MHALNLSWKLILCLLLPYSLLAQNNETVNRTKKIIKKTSIPALSLAQLNGSDNPNIIALGHKSAKEKNAVDQNTIFSAASLSKPVVAYITLQLVHQNKFDLDRPLVKYFDYEDVAADPRHQQVTARHILSHTSGLPNWRPRGKDLTFRQDPGLSFKYSGEGFVWLSKVLASLTEKKFETLAQEMVFQPLGMERTSYIWRDTLETNYALPHDKYAKPRRKYFPMQPNAAASLQTTAKDYALFLNALLDAKFISKPLQTEMFSPQVSIENYEKQGQKISWGLGVGIQEKADGLEFWHWGDNGTFKAYFTVSPSTKKGLVYFANSSNGLSITQDITDLYLGTAQPAVRWNDYPQLGLWYHLMKVFK